MIRSVASLSFACSWTQDSGQFSCFSCPLSCHITYVACLAHVESSCLCRNNLFANKGINVCFAPTSHESGLVSTTMATEAQRVSSPPVPLSPLTTGFPTSNGSANLVSVASPSRSSATKHEHPYAFKSTSSAILTRSNSIGNNSWHTHHLYAPPTPQTPGLSRSQSTGHRHTRSLNNVAPPTPLPMPPSPSTPVRLGSFDAIDASSPVSYLVKRHETLPSLPPSTQTTNELKISDLPVSVLL
jgi:hypothetical protein